MSLLPVMPNPAHMAWQDWADTVVGFNPVLRHRISSDLDWESFADQLTLFVPHTPDHKMFDDWRAWADALKRSQPL